MSDNKNSSRELTPERLTRSLFLLLLVATVLFCGIAALIPTFS